MKILAKQNRDLVLINKQNTQNENDAEKILLQVPEQYEDFNKKIVFNTKDGNIWDIIVNNEYLIPKAITKYEQVEFYIWLTKDDVDFRSRTYPLKFYHNTDASDEITDEEIGRVNTVINLLEEEITKVENLESEIDDKLTEIDTAIDEVNSAIQETQNLDLDAQKVNKTTTITITKKNGTEKSVSILDGQDGTDLQFMWQGTSLGIKTENQQEYTFVDLQGVQGPTGPQGEPFTIKKTYSSVAEMNADFNNMQLGDYVMIASSIEVEDNAKLYTRGANQWIFITDFSGATGIRGETGLTPNIQIGTVTQGSSFSVTRTGTNENPILNFTLVKGDKGDKGEQGEQGDDYVLTSQDKEEIAGMVDVPVKDVQLNGTSVVSDGVANIPKATGRTLGVVVAKGNYGIGIYESDGNLRLIVPSDANIQSGSNASAITPTKQHLSTFYGLAKVAGHDEKNSTLPAGEYSDEAKIAIQKMLGIYQAPWELLNDFTLEEESGFDLTADDNGTPYNLREVLIHVYYPANLEAVTAGYGRYLFYDNNNKYLVAETGRYSASTNYMYKYVKVERKSNLTECKYTDCQPIGGVGAWRTKNMNDTYNSSGFSLIQGNITRIKMNDSDKEPAGVRIKIYGQRAY